MKKLALIILLFISFVAPPAPCLSQSRTATLTAKHCILQNNTVAYAQAMHYCNAPLTASGERCVSQSQNCTLSAEHCVSQSRTTTLTVEHCVPQSSTVARAQTNRPKHAGTLTAYAQSTVQWVRVVDDDICLYATDDSAKVICLLEKSYYLSVLSEGDKMYMVAVMGEQADFPQISGYVWKTAVEPCDKTPVAPIYPTVKLVVCDDSATVKLSPVPSAETLIVATNTQQMSYYGRLISYNVEWYYVYHAGRFGYVLADSVTQPQIALHPTPIKTEVEVIAPALPSDTVDAPNDNDDQNGGIEGGSAMEIALIVFIVLLAAGLTLAVFLPGNVKKNNVFDQDI